jgi:hypothetical protein
MANNAHKIAAINKAGTVLSSFKGCSKVIAKYPNINTSINNAVMILFLGL